VFAFLQNLFDGPQPICGDLTLGMNHHEHFKNRCKNAAVALSEKVSVIAMDAL